MVVYLTTNLINGKKYIGKDSKNNPKYLGSGSLLKKDIEIFNKNNFKKEIIEYCTVENLKEREEYWIEFYDAIKSNEFYNLRKNVNSWFENISLEKKSLIYKKISDSNKGKTRTQETKDKMSKASKGCIKGNYHTDESKSKISKANKGNKHSQETKNKISKIQKGCKKGNFHTDESKKKISEGNNGKKLSIETKEKISKSNKGKIISQETKEKISKNKINHNMYTDEWRKKISNSLKGRIFSQETKDKMSSSFKGRIYSQETKDKMSLARKKLPYHSFNSKPILQYDLEGNFIKEWPDIKSASIEFNGVRSYLNNKPIKKNKFIWKYKNK